MDIGGLELEGTPDEVAEQLFKQMIGPMFNHLAKTSPDLAREFGFCVAGNAVACYLNSFGDVDLAKKAITELTEKMATDIKRHKNKVC